MSMKSFRGPRWMFQCYWPDVWLGPNRFGVKLDNTLILTQYSDGDWSAGVNLFGFGLGLARFAPPAIGVDSPDGAKR